MAVERVVYLLQQDVGLHGFGYIVARSRLHGQHGVLHFGIARHHDEGRLHVLLAQPVEQKQTVVVGQTEVRQYEVEACAVGHCPCRGAYRACFLNRETFFAQPCLHHGGVCKVVFNYKDTCHVG